MDYEKIIVELLSRIQTLEEQVAVLMQHQEKKKGDKVTTNDIKEYIENLKLTTQIQGSKTLILKSGDIHKELKLKAAMPQVCNAMYACMKSDDIVLHTTPSGKSSTIEIEYKL